MRLSARGNPAPGRTGLGTNGGADPARGGAEEIGGGGAGAIGGGALATGGGALATGGSAGAVGADDSGGNSSAGVSRGRCAIDDADSSPSALCSRRSAASWPPDPGLPAGGAADDGDGKSNGGDDDCAAPPISGGNGRDVRTSLSWVGTACCSSRNTPATNIRPVVAPAASHRPLNRSERKATNASRIMFRATSDTNQSTGTSKLKACNKQTSSHANATQATAPATPKRIVLRGDTSVRAWAASISATANPQKMNYKRIIPKIVTNSGTSTPTCVHARELLSRLRRTQPVAAPGQRSRAAMGKSPPRLDDDLGVRLRIGEIGERLGDAVDADAAVTIEAASTCPSAIRRSERCKFLRRVAQHVLDVELLHDAEHRLGSCRSPCRRRPRRCAHRAARLRTPAASGRERRRIRRSARASAPAARPATAAAPPFPPPTSRHARPRSHRAAIAPDRPRCRRRAFRRARAAPANNRRRRSDAVP